MRKLVKNPRHTLGKPHFGDRHAHMQNVRRSNLYLVNGYLFAGGAWSRSLLEILESLQITHVLSTTPTAKSSWSKCASNA